MERRMFLRQMGFLAGMAGLPAALARAHDGDDHPNVILCMADDLGWGDTGFNGNTVVRTPHLDELAGRGLRFERFYAAAPVCSPTRGSCITGRHPYRYGIRFANVGHMKPEEVTLAQALKPLGYTTGHFGKWHLGTLTTRVRDSNRGRPGRTAHYAPPWEHGFDVCCSTEAKVPTWDPMRKPAGRAPGRGWEALSPGAESESYGTYYWEGPEQRVTTNLEGDDSRVIMDRAIPFIEAAAGTDQPFLAVIWFHTPHLPVVAGPEFAEMYREHDLYARNYFGCITAMDRQMGRLWNALKRLQIEHSTMLWFCSDNGPEGRAGHAPGSAGPFRGRKRSLYEGGVRVPGLLVWPERVARPRSTAVPCCTSDYFPTVLDALGYRIPEQDARPYDGVSLLPLIDGRIDERPRPVAFESRKQVSLTDNRYKIISTNGGETFELYDLIEDPGETEDLAAEKPEIIARMRDQLARWRASCRASVEGRDYPAME